MSTGDHRGQTEALCKSSTEPSSPRLLFFLFLSSSSSFFLFLIQFMKRITMTFHAADFLNHETIHFPSVFPGL